MGRYRHHSFVWQSLPPTESVLLPATLRTFALHLTRPFKLRRLQLNLADRHLQRCLQTSSNHWDLCFFHWLTTAKVAGQATMWLCEHIFPKIRIWNEFPTHSPRDQTCLFIYIHFKGDFLARPEAVMERFHGWNHRPEAVPRNTRHAIGRFSLRISDVPLFRKLSVVGFTPMKFHQKGLSVSCLCYQTVHCC